MSKPQVSTGQDHYIKTEHFNVKIEPFSKSIQFFTDGDVGNYYMAISRTNIDELIEFLKAAKATIKKSSAERSESPQGNNEGSK